MVFQPTIFRFENVSFKEGMAPQPTNQPTNQPTILPRGKILLSEFKAVTLASLRSLLPQVRWFLLGSIPKTGWEQTLTEPRENFGPPQSFGGEFFGSETKIGSPEHLQGNSKKVGEMMIANNLARWDGI